MKPCILAFLFIVSAEAGLLFIAYFTGRKHERNELTRSIERKHRRGLIGHGRN